LFERRPFRLTPEGEELFKFIRPFFDNLDLMAEKLRGGRTLSLRIAASTVVGMAATWLTALALARILDRREFGIAALALLAVAVFQLFQDSGLHAALIQRQTRIQEAVDTAGLYAPLTGLVLALACVVLAPLGARFFHEPELTSLIRGLGAVFLLRSFAIVPSALIQRELLFARTAVIGVVASVLQLGTAVTLALLGAGAWAVIGAQILVSAWWAIAATVASPLRPHPSRASYAELRELLRYGRHIVVGNLVGFVNSNTDPVAVGRLFGAVPLGAYTLGFQTGSQSVTAVTGVSNLIVFPAYSKLQDDMPRFRRAYLRSLRFVSTISVPAGIGLAAVSAVFVRVLYGDKWAAAIPVLAIISLYGLFLSVFATTGEVFKAAGRPQLFARMGIFQVAILFALIAALYPFGIVGFALARAGATFIMGWVALYFAGRILELGISEWIRTLSAPMAAGLLMGAGVVATQQALATVVAANVLVLALLIAEGVVLYVVAMRVVARARWEEFVSELTAIVPLKALRLLALRGAYASPNDELPLPSSEPVALGSDPPGLAEELRAIRERQTSEMTAG
ncbi:MAG: oligosaccharide flippase family protein, partial [Gaiellaceae bacterium]